MTWHIVESYSENGLLSGIYLVSLLHGKIVRILVKRDKKKIEIYCRDIDRIDYRSEEDKKFIIVTDNTNTQTALNLDKMHSLKYITPTNPEFYQTIKHILEHIIPIIW